MSSAQAKSHPVHLLVVEDDPDIADLVAHTLRKEGYRCSVAQRGQHALDTLAREDIGLVVLDLMLPDMRGLDILRSIRRSGPGAGPKVIVLTAKKDEADRILGFELGADDYVTKPFSPRELALRVRSVLQRAGVDEQPLAVPRKEFLRAGPIELDTESYVALISGQPVGLTLTEFRLLTELVRAGGRVRSRESLLTEVWGYDTEAISRTVDTHIRRLRSKIGVAARWIQTVRGVGYRIQRPDE